MQGVVCEDAALGDDAGRPIGGGCLCALHSCRRDACGPAGAGCVGRAGLHEADGVDFQGVAAGVAAGDLGLAEGLVENGAKGFSAGGF